MKSLLQTPLFMILALALVAVGCDQSEQNVGFTTGDEYRVRISSSASGDAASDSITVPDTVSYYVVGYTVEKDYSWSINGTEPPSELSTPAPDQTFLWEDRGGEFITVVYGPNDPIANAPTSGDEANEITVDASGDDINALSIPSVATAEVISGGQDLTVGVQVGRFGVFSALTGAAAATDVAGVLTDDAVTTTLFAPDNRAFAVLDTLDMVPTNAVDDDEPADSGMLADFLKYHALSGVSASSSDLSTGSYETLLVGEGSSPATIDVDVSSSGVTINNQTATVTQVDMPATNGFVHKIDNVLMPPVASVDFTDKAAIAGGAQDTVTVDGVYLPDGGFVVLHEQQNDGSAGPVVGNSVFLEPGIHTDVQVLVDEITTTTTLGAMPHTDDGDETYEFPILGQDGPYQQGNAAIIDYGDIEPAE